MFQKIILVKPILFFPVSFFQYNPKIHNLKVAFQYNLIISFLGILISYLMNLIIPFSGMVTSFENNQQPGAYILLEHHFTVYIIFQIIFFIAAFLFFILLAIPSSILGVKFSYSKMYNLLVYSFTPVYLFGSFRFIELTVPALSLWLVILFAIGYKELCLTTYFKSFIILLITLFVIFFINAVI